MTAKKITIGFDRYIERQWLDQTAEWVVQGITKDQLHENIDLYLFPYIKGETSLRKSKNVLFGIWSNENNHNQDFKEKARRLYQQANLSEKLAIHWGLAVASYPFFVSLTRLLGRLYRLQDDVSSQEIVRRAVEQHGDTESVRRATTRLLQSLCQWGVLEPAQKSVFRPAKEIQIHNSEIVTWLVGSIFYSTDRERYSLQELLSDPAWFPFETCNSDFDIGRSNLLEIVHRGVGDALISLAKT